uniref:Uncharacterized protein n=1 Tax=Triticum urartu TaxID=4572 RepID=A0A8R7VDD5_TRIUA
SPGEFYLAHHCRAASPSLPEEKQVQLTEDGMLTTPTEKVGRCGAGNVEVGVADVLRGRLLLYTCLGCYI